MQFDTKDRQALTKILEHCERVIEFVPGTVSLEEFTSNKMMHDATVHNIVQIGELAYSILSEGCKMSIKGVPWRAVMSMRHKLVHHYGDCTLDVIYDTARSNIPQMRLVISRALSVGSMDLFGDSK